MAVAAAPILLALHPRSFTRPGRRPSFFFVVRTLPSRCSHLSGLERIRTRDAPTRAPPLWVFDIPPAGCEDDESPIPIHCSYHIGW
ncbi:hypothetical protein K438DRAFT_1978876 [Mycena galopus ATCC 62051]|nr:hypothetical protein K438DRAFT_1978876 [Mycena galopus ATCC 62051]